MFIAFCRVARTTEPTGGEPPLPVADGQVAHPGLPLQEVVVMRDEFSANIGSC
jgi:hypothetical protein